MEKLIFDYEESSSKHVPDVKDDLPVPFNRQKLELPNLSEVTVVRHFIALSKLNYGVDTNFYPLGSCTMKYNPKINEDMYRLSGFNIHPYTPEDSSQGALEMMYVLQEDLKEVTGMDAISLQPAAGAHGELACCMIAKKYFNGKRKTVVLPDSAHGTNPASAAMCDMAVVTIKSNERGAIDLEELKKAMNEDVAIFMLTNPSTLGLFEENIEQVAKIVHHAGALMYCDGANMNAMVGKARPGDQGFDMMHLNLHKTFSVPHGGGGPGAGPIGVKKHLAEFLPSPQIVKNGQNFKFQKPSKSIGKVKSFYGNFGALVRSYTYIKALGSEGLKNMTESAVLNANYIMASLKHDYYLPYDRTCGHECVFSDKYQEENHVTTMDIAKRLLDYGFHAPTIYFPLIVHGAIMIEPTETESKATLDAFIDAMKKIAKEAKENPDLVRSAPVSTPVGRLDGVRAARTPDLTYGPACTICSA